MILSAFSRYRSSFSKKSALQAGFWSLIYALTCAFLLHYFSGAVGESPIWIPAGIALGVFLTLGPQYWPLLFSGAFAGEMLGGFEPGMAALIAGGSIFSALGAQYCLKKITLFNFRIEATKDYFILMAIGFLAALVSTGINTQFLIMGGLLSPADFRSVFLKWFTGDFFGMAFVAPVFLILSTPFEKSWKAAKLIKLTLLLLVAIIVGQGVFFGWFKEFINLTDKGNIYLLFILLMGYRFGRHGAALLFCVLLIQAILGAIFGAGFVGPDLLTSPSRMAIWVYLGVASIGGLFIGLAIESFEKKNEALELASKVLEGSERRFRQIVASTPVLMATYDLKTEITDYVNPHFTKALGYSAADFSQPNSWWQTAYPDPDYRMKIEAEWHKRAQFSQESNVPFEELETLTTCKDGSVRNIAWGCFLVLDRLVIYGLDVTDQRRLAETLNVSSAVYRAMGEAVVIKDAASAILMANGAFQKLTGYDDAELQGKLFTEFLVKRHGAHSYSDIFTTLQAMGRWEGQAWLRLKSGEEVLRFISIYSTYDKDGLALQRVVLISEVTDQRKARELIHHQANFDSLTGLPNRRLMFDRLEQFIKQATRTNKHIAVIYIDLDNFKDINDSRGHDFGDQLLKEIAERLRDEVRETDTVARIGGDEFVILLGDLEKPEAADLIIRQVSLNLANPILIENQRVYVTASIGISMFPNDGDASKALLLSADQAMYSAKANGRNTYQYFTQSLQIKATYRAGIISDLRAALEKKEFEIVYQPIIDLTTGRIAHAEALLRWRRANGEIVMPGSFVHIAEESGLIVEIGDWVWNEVVTFLTSLIALPGFTMAVNVSAAQFNSSQHSAPSWINTLQENNVEAHSIVMEITERMMLNQSARVKRKISMFQEVGCKFSIDDFGTGYSSLASLKNLNFNYIKIDADFIGPLQLGGQDAALVFAMISMAKGLGLGSIAEGVETAEQAHILREMNCTYAQGYLYSEPLSPEDFRRYMARSLLE